MLRYGTPQEAGLDARHVAGIVPAAEAYLTGAAGAAASRSPGRGGGDSGGDGGAFPGFVLLAARGGVVVAHEARGHAVRWAAERGGRVVELPQSERTAVGRDTVFDLASLSKLFTAVVTLRLAELGLLELDGPVARYLAGFPDSRSLTVRSLLSHTSGLPPWLDLGPYPDNAARLAAIAAQLHGGRAQAAPGTRRYSDLGLITAGAVAEAVTGARLDELVAEHVTGPLGMTDTGYRPPPELLPRIAATEYQPWTGRGIVRGEVHDENALHLGGVAGHAGLFGTARDVAALGQAVIDGGVCGDARLLRAESMRVMLTDHGMGVAPGPSGPGGGQGLGWRLNEPAFMGELASSTTCGHTGFTGTSLVADPATGALLVLLSNRVHPGRAQGVDGAYRRAPADRLARAIAA